jgi:hypothetical protein
VNPYPLIYCPKGVKRPECCPWLAGMGLLSGKGPDVAEGGEGGGFCFPGPYRDGPWLKTGAGWYVLLDGHKPQHLGRTQPHPRIVKWQAVPGHLPETLWRIPVMIAPMVKPEGHPDKAACYMSALDRVWSPAGWSAPVELEPIQRQLLALAEGVPLHDSAEERDRMIAMLAIDLMSLGQWVDADLIAAAGWLTDAVVIRVVEAACGIESEVAGV